MSHRFDTGCIKLPNFIDVLQNVLQLTGEFLELRFIQSEPGQLGDMAGVFDADLMVGHGRWF